MNKYFFILLLGLAACNSATTTDNTGKRGTIPTGIVNNPHTADGIDTVAAALKPILVFPDTLHDFGIIHQDEVVQHEFSFSNNGKTALVISFAAGSCGCTVADYPHDPIQPGKSGTIKVTFNSAGKKGHQEKSVTIHANTLQKIHMLYIKGDIESK